MREPLKDKNRLEHIVSAIDLILGRVEGMKYEDFVADKLLFGGIVYHTMIIGEAAYRLTKRYRQAHAETDWDGMTKLRHVLVHDYYQINVKTVWDVIQHELPLLLTQVTRYIAETNWDEWDKNYKVISETAVHKQLIQTAARMKNDGLPIKQIMRYTGLSADEIDEI